jgi:hypothetical protein
MQVDIIFTMLLRKCTETSVFIADEAKRTVCVMMDNVSFVSCVESVFFFHFLLERVHDGADTFIR